LYTGGSTTNKQVIVVLVSVPFPKNDFSHEDRFDTSSAIPLQSPHCDLPDLLRSLFSSRSPQQVYTFCSQEWFGNPACTALPMLRPHSKIASSLLQHVKRTNFQLHGTRKETVKQLKTISRLFIPVSPEARLSSGQSFIVNGGEVEIQMT